MTSPVTNGATLSRGAANAALAILAVAQFLLALDYSIVYVALPSVGGDLSLTESTVQWVVSGYAVFFAGFLIVGGRISSRFGPRNVYLTAMVLFGVASLAGGIASDGATLMAARAAQGVGAALLQPAVIALINTTFAAGPERNRALGVWGTVGASGLAAGVVAGGLLTTVSWRWVFLINLPVTALCVLAGLRLLPRVASRKDLRLNVISAVLCTGTVLAAALALTQAAAENWTHPTTLACFAAGAVLLVAFVLRERSSSRPLVDPIVRRTRTLLVGCGSTALYMASVGNMFFVVTLLVQELRGYGPIAAGLAFLPMAAAIVLANSVTARVVAALGVRATLTLAFVVAAGGLALLAAQVDGERYVVDLLPGLLITGFAHGVIYVSMFIVGTRDIADHHQGLAGGLMTTTQYMSGALGIAVLVLVLGPGPQQGDFGRAFLTTAGAAALGALLVWLGLSGRAEPARTAGRVREGAPR
ncbi:MFS transporter [Streptomyces alkaliphilus]|uniref:MFS transporter n=2 Tax=Streptomyces alkaliphilus TaxID=1472722 RepID=A0A7W3T9N8_9ACTN|nr:MFS transporter [Streptomyces alkaliphilus]